MYTYIYIYIYMYIIVLEALIIVRPPCVLWNAFPTGKSKELLRHGEALAGQVVESLG